MNYLLLGALWLLSTSKARKVGFLAEFEFFGLAFSIGS